MSEDTGEVPQPHGAWVRAQAVRTLGIVGDQRLDEIEEVAGLLGLISDAMQRLQETRPEEPAPATVFRPEHDSRDFWEGRPGGS
jgi:hypothetical protein